MAKTKPNDIVVHRDWLRQFPVVSRTDGICVYDASGKRYIDASGGSSVVVGVGHGVKEIPEAMYEQSKQYSFYPTHLFTTERALELGELMSSLAPGEMKDACKIWLTCTGTDATDDSIRLARQHYVERGLTSRFTIISRWQSFHGNNIYIESVGGHTFRRNNYVPMFRETPHIPPAYCYRCPYEKTFPACDLMCARELERMICQSGKDYIAGFIAEPVVGAALGAVPAPPGYFMRIKEICEKYGVLFIADEVMTGLGRTGQMFGMDLWKVKPDMMSLAKGLSAGYLPLGAVAVRGEILELLKKKKSNIASGHTFSAHHITAAVGIAAVQYLLKNDLVSKSRENGAYLLKKLEKLLKHPIVGDVRGRGLFAGIELVKNKKTKQPFPSAKQMAARIGTETLKRGLISYPGTGSVDGVSGDHVFLAPPLIITKPQIDDMLSILDESIREVEKKVR